MRLHILPDNSLLLIETVSVNLSLLREKESSLPHPDITIDWPHSRRCDSLHDALELLQASPTDETWVVSLTPSIDVCHEHIHSHQPEWMIAVFNPVFFEAIRGPKVEHAANCNQGKCHYELFVWQSCARIHGDGLAHRSVEKISQNHVSCISVSFDLHSLESHGVLDVIREAWFGRFGCFQQWQSPSCLEAMSVEYMAGLVTRQDLHDRGEEDPYNLADVNLERNPEQLFDLDGASQALGNRQYGANGFVSDRYAGEIVDIKRECIALLGFQVIKMNSSNAVRWLDAAPIGVVALIYGIAERGYCVIENGITKRDLFETIWKSFLELRVWMGCEVPAKLHHSFEFFVFGMCKQNVGHLLSNRDCFYLSPRSRSLKFEHKP